MGIEAARRWRGAGTALVIVSLLLVGWATLAPRGGAMLETDAGRFCLWCGDARVTDALANVVLFIPLGFALAMNGMRPPLAVASCLLLTLGIETTQFFGIPAGRIASVSDATTNVLGGAIGAALAVSHRALLFPRPTGAVRLAVAWTLVCAALLVATAWGVSAPPAADAVAAVPPRASPLAVVPGSGWYHGTIIGALIDDVELPHRGTGPVIVEATPQGRRTVRVALTGRDERTGPVTLLYIHSPFDVGPGLQLEQRGPAVALRAGSRAGTAGFALLETLVPHAFSVDSMRPSDTTLVTARNTQRELSLVVERGSRRWSSVQLRTPTIGWALIQSLVRVSSRIADALTAAWLMLLLLPVGYWGWWAGSLRAYVTLGAAVTIATAVVIGVRTFGIAYPPLWQWCTLAGGIALGMLLGQLIRGYHHATHASIDR